MSRKTKDKLNPKTKQLKQIPQRHRVNRWLEILTSFGVSICLHMIVGRRFEKTKKNPKNYSLNKIYENK